MARHGRILCSLVYLDENLPLVSPAAHISDKLFIFYIKSVDFNALK